MPDSTESNIIQFPVDRTNRATSEEMRLAISCAYAMSTVSQSPPGSLSAVIKPLIDELLDKRKSHDIHCVAAAILDLDAEGERTDVVSVAERLERAGRLQEIGGMGFLGNVINLI